MLFLMMSLSSFSQTGTTTKTIKLSIPKPIVQETIKDLLSGDSAKKELTNTLKILSLREFELQKKDTLLLNLNTKVLTLEEVLGNKDKEILFNTKISKDYKKALQKQQRINKIYKTGSAVGVIAILVLLIK